MPRAAALDADGSIAEGSLDGLRRGSVGRTTSSAVSGVLLLAQSKKMELEQPRQWDRDPSLSKGAEMWRKGKVGALKMRSKERAEMLVPLRLSSPRWWHPPEAVFSCADGFDYQHRALRTRAANVLEMMKKDQTSLSLERDFHRTLRSLRGHRYQVRRQLPMSAPRAGAPRAAALHALHRIR